MSDYKLPDLPSDEELGIAGLSEDDFDDAPKSPPTDAPPPAGPPKPPVDQEEGSTVLPGAPRWSGWVTLLVLALTAWLSSSYRQLPDTRAATAPDTAFASGRALPTVVELARAPHPTGSPEHTRVREEVVDALVELGFEPEVQTTTAVRSYRGQTRAATVRNVLARRPGTNSTGAILVMAHYDGVPSSPAAGDDASGVATVLEALRAVGAGAPLRNDVIVLISDAEELGLMGAQAFVEQHPWIADVKVVLNFEMRGTGGPSIMFETGSDNGWVVDQLRAFDPHPVANSATVAGYRRMPNDTDFSPFRDAGIQGLNFATLGEARHYHQPTDSPPNLSEASIQHHGERLTSALRWLGEVDVSQPQAPDQMYVALPFFGIQALPAALAIPVSLGLLLALLVVTFLASLRSARSRGFLASAILSTVAVALCAGAGWVLVQFVLPLHQATATGGLAVPVYNEVPYRIALVAACLAVVTGLFALGHRWTTPLEATLGALFLPVLSLVVLTFLAPLAAPLLQFPLAATILLLALLSGVGVRRARGTVAWLLALVLAIPVLAVVVPMLELFYLAFTMSAAVALGGLTGLLLLLILPALSATAVPNRWWMPLGSLLVAALATGTGLLMRAPSESRPLITALVYTMERDDQGIPSTARWIGTAAAAEGWLNEGAGAGDRFQPMTTVVADELDELPVPTRSAVWADAPLAAVPAPTVRVIADALVGTERLLTLGIQSGAGAEAIRINVPDGVELTSLNGASRSGRGPISLAPAVRSLEHWGEPEGELIVELSARRTAAWPLEILEILYRPEELFGEERYSRPPGFIERGSYFSDRAVILTPWTPRGASLAPGADSGQDADGSEGSPGLPDTTTAVDSTGPGGEADRPVGEDSVQVSPPDTGSLGTDTTAIPPDTTVAGR